jgi:N-hydroxyarylamine O-acetyltransferase
VPFENLDIHLGRPIVLDEQRLFEKIVTQRRGGFCYELNGLFAALLRALGFHVTYLSARDAHADGGYGPEFDHLALLVPAPQAIDGPPIDWLVDVGWGDTFCVPLCIDERALQFDGQRHYRLEPLADDLLVWQQHHDGTCERNYRVSLVPRQYTDFAAMCHYHQTSPDSLFTRQRLCTLATPTGRVTLTGSHLIVSHGMDRQERPIVDEAETFSLLKQYFGISPPP